MSSPPCPHIRQELDALLRETGCSEPDRDIVFADPDTVWRAERPNYDMVNLQYLKGKTQDHAKGSIEETVENLVKSWESEFFHKLDYSQWRTVDHEKFCVSSNGAPALSGVEAKDIGNYNTLMKECPAYNKLGQFSFESSHDLFRDAFPSGFPWEVLRVLSTPTASAVLFTWRHWATYAGRFQEVHSTGQLVELFGLCRVEMTAEGKIGRTEVFFDPQSFLEVLLGKKDVSVLEKGRALVGELTKTALERKRKK